MSDVKVSAEPSATTPLSGNEIVYVVQSNASKKATAQDIANLANSGMTITSQSGTSYTLVIGDAETKIKFTSAFAVALTVPLNADVNFSIGTSIILQQYGAGMVTIAGDAGVTLHSYGDLFSTAGQYAQAVLTKDAADVWSLEGTLA